MNKNLLPTPQQVRIAKQQKEQERIALGFCPQCGAKLAYQSGCAMCLDCSWSRCDL